MSTSIFGAVGAATDLDMLNSVERWAAVRGWRMLGSEQVERGGGGGQLGVMEADIQGWRFRRSGSTKESDVAWIEHWISRNRVISVTHFHVSAHAAVVWAISVEAGRLVVEVGRCRMCRGHGQETVLSNSNPDSDRANCHDCAGSGRECVEIGRLILDAQPRHDRSGSTEAIDALLVVSDNLQTGIHGSVAELLGVHIAHLIAGISEKTEAAVAFLVEQIKHPQVGQYFVPETQRTRTWPTMRDKAGEDRRKRHRGIDLFPSYYWVNRPINPGERDDGNSE